MPAGPVAEPFIDADDVADVAVAALLTEASGHEVRYVPVTTEEFVALLADAGVPIDEAAGLGDLFAGVLDGTTRRPPTASSGPSAAPPATSSTTPAAPPRPA